VLSDWPSAPVPPKVRAALAYLEKLVKHPDAVTAEDIAPLHAAGIDDAGIRDLTYICAAFSLIVRVADTFGFAVPDGDQFTRMASLVAHTGYRLRI
jgi:alkylhydroperoxidase family enzyme